MTGPASTAAKTFQADNLPAGLSIDPQTGVISGLTQGVDVISTLATVTVSAQGFTGQVSVTTPIRVHGLTERVVFGPGFAFDNGSNPPQLVGSLGVPLSIDADPAMRLIIPQGTTLGIGAPAGTLVTFGLAPGTDVPGGSLDPSTGVFTWTPDQTGTFHVQFSYDATLNGVTRHVTTDPVSVVVR